MLGGRLLVEFVREVGIMTGKHDLRQSVFCVQSLEAVEGRAVSIPAYESGVHDIGVIQHELLNGCASAGAGVANLVELLKKWKPTEASTG